MKTTKKIFLSVVSSRFWPELILATLLSLFSVLSLLFHIWRDFVDSVIFKEKVPFWVFLDQEKLVLIPLFLLIVILTLLFYRLHMNKRLVDVALNFIERDEDVIYFLANYIVSRGKSKPGYLSENYVSDIRFIMELSMKKLKLVGLDSLEVLLGVKIDDIDNIVNECKNDAKKLKGEIGDKIEAIEEITKEDNIEEVSFLLNLAREPSFSTALRALAKRIKELSDDYSDNLNPFNDKFCFFEKKSKLRMGYNLMNVIKREIREGLRNRIWDIYADASFDPKKDWCDTLRGYLFCWTNVPGDDNDKLKNFLKDEFDIEWAENAKIHKSNDLKTICILGDENSVEIMMDAKKEKVTLIISDGRHDLKVKKEGDKLNIYTQVNRISGNNRNILGIISEILETFIKSESYSKLLLECVMEEKIKKRYLFSIDAKFEDDLNNGILSEELKNIFKTKEFPLSENAKVTEEKEKKWVIANEEKFIIRKEDGKLNIYNDISNFTNNVIFIYGYSVSILNVLDVIDLEDKQKMDIYLIKTEDKATIFEEDAKIRKRLTANYYPSPSIYSVKEIMSMDPEDFRGRDIIFLLGIELINKDNLALQTYNAGIIIKKIIRNFKKDEDPHPIQLSGRFFNNRLYRNPDSMGNVFCMKKRIKSV